MSNIGNILLRLMGDGGFIEIMDDATRGDSKFLYDFAAILIQHGKHDEALDVCDLILRDKPRDLDTFLLSVRAFSEKGNVEQALERLIHIKSLGLGGAELVVEIQSQLRSAVGVYGDCFSSGDFERASNICELLTQLCPGVLMFQKARLEVRGMLQRRGLEQLAKIRGDYFNSLNELAFATKAAGDFEAELGYRVEVFRSPLDAARYSASRLDNIMAALSRILGVDLDVFDAERLGLARELLTAIPAIPSSPLGATGFDGDIGACYDRFYRYLLGTIDLDAIFGPATEPLPLLPTRFVSSAGEPMDISVIAERGRDLGAKVVFFTSTSAEYFGRYAQTYVSSVLNACDCNCMVFICVCAPHDRLVEIVSPLGIDDPRLVFSSDGFDPQAREFQIFTPTEGNASPIPGPYYASAALLRTDYILQHLGLPVFVTGIDTVLQRGVVDLLESTADADVVLNKIGSGAALGSQLVNNLVLTYPTENGLLFAQFLKKYLGGHLEEALQPGYLDQLDLQMAKHHLMTNGASPTIKYFGDFDINNVMFNPGNYRQYFDQMRSYRFLNMFVGGCADDPLTAEHVALESV